MRSAQRSRHVTRHTNRRGITFNSEDSSSSAGIPCRWCLQRMNRAIAAPMERNPAERPTERAAGMERDFAALPFA
jgi:hypothetical protein